MQISLISSNSVVIFHSHGKIKLCPIHCGTSGLVLITILSKYHQLLQTNLKRMNHHKTSQDFLEFSIKSRPKQNFSFYFLSFSFPLSKHHNHSVMKMMMGLVMASTIKPSTPPDLFRFMASPCFPRGCCL